MYKRIFTEAAQLEKLEQAATEIKSEYDLNIKSLNKRDPESKEDKELFESVKDGVDELKDLIYDLYKEAIIATEADNKKSGIRQGKRLLIEKLLK